jgi:hypothetical protein
MARNENPPFPRGQTYYNGGTIDTSNKLTNLIGKTWVFEDIDLSTTGAKATRTSREVECMLVRNDSGITLLPKRMVTQESGTTGLVDGYSTTTAQAVLGVVDEWLPSTGVVANDCFWIVVRGPTQILTDLAGGSNNLLPAETIVVALTAATSQCTTAGRLAPQDVTGATTALANNVQNAVGRCISAATTANTNTGTVVDVFARRW